MSDKPNKVRFLSRKLHGEAGHPGYDVKRADGPGELTEDWGILMQVLNKSWLWMSRSGTEFGTYPSFAEAKRRIRAELE